MELPAFSCVGYAEGCREALAEAMRFAMGCYQRDILTGAQPLSGANLRGKAKKWSGSYHRSRTNLLRRVGKAGIKIWIRTGDHGRKILVFGKGKAMGATDFMITAQGPTAKRAFANAVDKAKHDHGHEGYTGSIAEKSSFTMIELPEGRTAEEYADELLGTDDRRVANKWGPAGCIALPENRWLFFGYASC